jgi:hypothetical protein
MMEQVESSFLIVPFLFPWIYKRLKMLGTTYQVDLSNNRHNDIPLTLGKKNIVPTINPTIRPIGFLTRASTEKGSLLCKLKFTEYIRNPL